MPRFDLVVETTPENTFRVASVIGKFDIQSRKVVESFRGEIDIEGEPWKIGIIVGNSGTGKTTIAKALFGDYFVLPRYEASAIVDDMPEGKSIDEITKMYNAVGFSSPPSWLKPYKVLSQGEKMRVDLAYALLSEENLIVFDEFTSTVDREVAKIGSAAVSKSIRRSGKQFIAVSCHFDIIDWLEPDWVFDTNSMTIAKKNSGAQRLNLTSTDAHATYGEFLGSIII